MGWLHSGLTFSVGCLILMWAAGSGSVRVLQGPTCFSDYVNISTCEWEMARPTNCRAELRLFYQLEFFSFENHTCVPENRAGAVCVCHMHMDNVVSADTYQLDLWAGEQLLWKSSFKPSEHVKPLAPRNLTVHANTSRTWLLTWNNPYPPENHLYSELTYLVNISNENDPTDFRIYNVTYMGPTLRFAASTLKSGASYSAQATLEQRLPLGVSISCVVILAVCLSCYVSIIKIKKEWWDQIPNPAHSPLVAVVIQDSQVSLWGKRSQGQEPAKCPGEDGGFSPQGLEESCLLPPLENPSAQRPWATFPSVGPQEASSEDKEPLNPESSPPTQSPARLAFPEMPGVITDYPTCRSFSTFLRQSSGPGGLDSDPQLAEHLGEADPGIPAAPQQSAPPATLQPEPETWEQILRQSVLQCRAAPGPASAPSSGYREFVQPVKQGGAQDSGLEGFGPCGEAGYKAFSSLLAGSASCPGTSGVEPSSGEGGYKPFQSLTPGCPGAPAPVPVPLFTFGLDVEPPHSPQDSLLPGSTPECPGLEPVVKGEDSQKPPLSPEPATDPLRDDLGNGIVYSALTCHLCGHLKQCHGQEERGKAHVEASPCCGCCRGDGSSPPVSPLRALDAQLGGAPLEASLSPASLAPLGVSEE
eukprot:bmy_00812T0